MAKPFKSMRIGITEIWFSFVIVILAALSYEQAISLESGAGLVRVAIFFLLLAISFFVAKEYLKKSRTLRKELQKTYSIQLRRRDEQISQLKKEKDMFLNSALKRSAKSREIEDKLREALKDK